jgi:hypothetical protein
MTKGIVILWFTNNEIKIEGKVNHIYFLYQ